MTRRKNSPEAEVLRINFSTSSRRLAMGNLIQTLFFFMLVTQTCFTQWVQTKWCYPFGCSVQCFAISGTNLFAGTDVGGVFLSTNNGINWTAVNSGLTKLMFMLLPSVVQISLPGLGSVACFFRPTMAQAGPQSIWA